jgi:hypothetical protein
MSMAKTHTRTRCQGRTRAGKPCKRLARVGFRHCRSHQLIGDDVPEAEDELPDEATRLELAGELDQLVERLRNLTPGYVPPPFSARELLRLVEENLDRLSPELRFGILDKLRSAISQDLFDVDTWKGIWTMLNYTLQYQATCSGGA